MIRTLTELTVMAEGLVTYARNRKKEDYVADLNLHDILSYITTEFDIPFTASARPLITGGPVSLSRSIRNLIDNATRYATGVSVSLSATDTEAIICVDDEGPGINDELPGNIFSPFVRGEQSRSSTTGGHGPGLTITQEIIHAHAGTIALTNKAEMG
jgi:signal transduction histidine kinase